MKLDELHVLNVEFALALVCDVIQGEIVQMPVFPCARLDHDVFVSTLLHKGFHVSDVDEISCDDGVSSTSTLIN